MNADQRQIMAALRQKGWSETLTLGNALAWPKADRSVTIRRANSAGRWEDFAHVQAYQGRGWCDLAVNIATAAAKTGLTSEQFGSILHAIGGGDNGYARPGYRNYYDAGGSDRASLDLLVESGHMVKIREAGVYRVTPKGAAEVGCAGCLEQK
jgi:hypothetical protein